VSLDDQRRAMTVQINAEAAALPPGGAREALEAKYGQVYNLTELQARWKVTGFAAPFVVVERLADGVVGSMMFSHRPRYYHSWQAK